MFCPDCNASLSEEYLNYYVCNKNNRFRFLRGSASNGHRFNSLKFWHYLLKINNQEHFCKQICDDYFYLYINNLSDKCIILPHKWIDPEGPDFKSKVENLIIKIIKMNSFI